MKFDQDLCLNLQYDFGKMNSTLGSVVPLAMFLLWGPLVVTRDIPHICHFFYTDRIFENQILHPKKTLKMSEMYFTVAEEEEARPVASSSSLHLMNN